MPRQPRLLEAGSVVHIASRGALGAPIFRDDSDRRRFLTLYAAVARIRRWRLLAYCLMTNHYHLLVEPETPTVSKGMQLINGQYASIFNDRHKTSGCVFQGRFWARAVRSESYLHAVLRYIGLNPVKAGICLRAEDWHWGGHRELAAIQASKLVDVERTWGLLGTGDPQAYRDLFDRTDDPLLDLAIRSGSELSWDQVKQNAVLLHDVGHSEADLARATGRSARTVRRWLVDARG